MIDIEVSYMARLSCGCSHRYSVLSHPFTGAALMCPRHGEVRSLFTYDRQESEASHD